MIQSFQFNRLDVEFVAIEGIPEGEFSRRFRETSGLDRVFRDGFWFNASNRFFVLADYMAHARIENVVHLENDYVLYFDPTDKFQAFSEYADFSVPLDRVRAIPGIVWLKNSKVANGLAKYISENSHLDDMHNLGRFCYESPELNAKPLPTLPYLYAKKKDLDIGKYSSGIDLFGGVFDAAAIGQYVGGIHWMNNSADTTFFINESSDLNLDEFLFSWVLQEGLKSPVLIFDEEFTPVLGMHAHSKNLVGISPFNHGVPKDTESVVTGERIQALCELTIGTPSITQFHGRNNIQSEDLIELAEDQQGNLLPPSNDIIERVCNAKSIFLYTHLIPYFKYYLAPRIDSPFTLVTHNSDHSVTINDFQLLNHPWLKNWHAQNCEFSHTKLKPLPLGLQNQQWGVEKIQEIVSAGKKISKEKILYVNFSTHTHPSRVAAMQVMKELKYPTIELDVNYQTYLQNLAIHKFCLCPRGNGIDTHRFWEAQYLDCIPIILWRDWTMAYSEMPILILDSWNDLQELDLEKIYISLTNKKYSRVSLDLQFIDRQINDI
ncbi:exostosin domain-containing protein [Polynucleobacter sinensis]|uniref:exostosin domain-containing protein n=1 Tax=Polynucleobacter sinensis TaxID=1743157 RepID=UPI00155DFFCA|nr:exostosin family protein [Polynucleobacter sinensis]